MVEWLRSHDELSAVFVAHQTGGTPYRRIGGRSPFESRCTGQVFVIPYLTRAVRAAL